MTTEEVKRRAELYSALAEGKTIQVKNMDGEWTDVKPEELNYIPEELAFRIKPEPKYRPFRAQEECWEEMHKHPDFGWIKSKRNQVVTLIGRIFTLNGDLTLTWSSNEGYDLSPSDVFSDYTFTDGAPFGIKEE